MQRHIIKRQILDLQAPSQKGSFELQNRISALYRNKIIPLIDTLFNQLSNPDEIHRIDSLEIDLGIVDINDLEAQFVAKVEEQLHLRLVEAIKSNDRDQTQQESSDNTNEPRTTQKSTTEHTLDQSHLKPSVEKNKSPAMQQAGAKQRHRIRPSSSHPIRPDSSDSQLEIFKHFIQTGSLLWWAEQLSHAELVKCLDDLITHQPERIKPVLLHTVQDQQQLRRLIEQFSDANLLAMVGLLAPSLHNFITDFTSDLLEILKKTNLAESLSYNKLRLEQWRGILFSLTSGIATVPDKYQLIRQTLLHIATSFNISYPKLLEEVAITVTQLQQFDSNLPDIIEQICNTKSKQQREQSQTNKKTPIDKQSEAPASEILDSKLQQLEQDESQRSKQRFNESDELYLANAGLILLWPFLPHLFETLGLIGKKGDRFILQAKSDLIEKNKSVPFIFERAVHLLQYLVDESSESPEHLLPLNKLLCGLDLMEPVSASIDISEQEKAECEKLLTAVIQHWTALKNTSIDGLRRAFLQREAILRVRDGGWLLQVERATHDILLDNIPWSTRLIKLPWMEELIYVEW